MDVLAAADEEGGAPVRARHISKRALRNKSLSVSFDEKDLKDFVGGFHKRKKKRRKEALQQQEEALRRKRIELRKKRKLERDFVQFGGAQPDSSTVAAKPDDEEQEIDEDNEPVASVSGTMTYDNDNVQVIVTTSEISRDVVPEVVRAPSTATEGSDTGKQNTVVSKKKQLKKAPMKRSRPKTQSKKDKRDKKMGKKKPARR